MRLQIRLKPYKRNENNEIEMQGLIAGAITLYSGIVFVAQGNSFTGFKILIMTLMFIFNGWFLFVWFYLMLCSLNLKNQTFLSLLRIYSLFLCKQYKQILEHSISSGDEQLKRADTPKIELNPRKLRKRNKQNMKNKRKFKDKRFKGDLLVRIK